MISISGPGCWYPPGSISSTRFVIQTSEPNVEVSWQVTGIRQGPYANLHRIPEAVEKASEEKGYYLHPDAYGQPASRAIGTMREKQKLEH